MLKKKNLILGFVIAFLSTLTFAIVFWDEPENICRLELEKEILLTRGEMLEINGLDQNFWEIEIEQPEVVEVFATKIHALEKGKTQIKFSEKGNPGCIFETNVTVINLDSEIFSQRLEKELKIDLPKAQAVDNISPLLPSN